jgi:hypothetical protein
MCENGWAREVLVASPPRNPGPLTRAYCLSLRFPFVNKRCCGGLEGKDALRETARIGNAAKMKILLDREGIDPATKNETLLAAVQSPPPLVIQMSPEEENVWKKQREQAASVREFDYAETVKVLLDSGASIEVRDETGATPAAAFGHTDTVKPLLVGCISGRRSKKTGSLRRGSLSRLAILTRRAQRIAGCFELKVALLHGDRVQRSHFYFAGSRQRPTGRRGTGR